MTAARLTLALVGAAAIGGAVLWAVSDRPTTTPDPVAPVQQPPADEPDAPPVATGQIAPPPPTPAKNPAAGKLQLPNGGYAEPLNGVKNPPKLLWQNPKWSPIVRQEHNGGLDWYVHADGTWSTTMMQWRPDLNRYDAASLSLHPRDMVETAPRASDLPPGVLIPDANAGGKDPKK